MFALYSADAWISEFIPDDDTLTLSIDEDENLFESAFDKSLSL